jgi:hypothetical protein
MGHAPWALVASRWSLVASQSNVLHVASFIGTTITSDQ